MDLATFAARVRFRTRDITQNHYDFDDEIQPCVDEFIRENYFSILKVVPRYYFSQETYNGITDAEDTANELYAFPDDFYAVGNIRRIDLTDKPKLKFVGDHLDIQKYNQSWLYPFYDPDPAVPLSLNETWTLHDATQFRIVPAPKATTYQYQLNYYRKWTEAIQTGDTVDVPELALGFCIAGVALDLLGITGDSTTDFHVARLVRIQEAFLTSNERPSAGLVPETEKWW